MRLFMDVHTIEGGVSAADVAAAHRKDLQTQGAHGVAYKRYWVDDEKGEIIRLVEADRVEDAFAKCIGKPPTASSRTRSSRWANTARRVRR